MRKRKRRSTDPKGRLIEFSQNWLAAFQDKNEEAALKHRKEAEPIFEEYPELRSEHMIDAGKEVYLHWQLFVGYLHLKELYESYFHLLGMVLKGDKKAVLQWAEKTEKIFQKHTGRGFPLNDLLSSGTTDWPRCFQITNRLNQDSEFYGTAEQAADRMIDFYKGQDDLQDFYFMTGLEKLDNYNARVASGDKEVSRWVRLAVDRHYNDLRKWIAEDETD